MEQSSRVNFKIAFLLHEFGRFPNHGGIAAVYSDLVDALLIRFPEIEVHVITTQVVRVDVDPRISVHYVAHTDNYLERLSAISRLLTELRFDYVETTDAFALASIFVVNSKFFGLSNPPVEVAHHTGFREIWEWGSGRPIEYAPDSVRRQAALEDVQFSYSQINTTTSRFLELELSTKHNKLKFEYNSFPNRDIDQDVSVSRPKRDGSFRILSIGRWEARKTQLDLINAVLNANEHGINVTCEFVGQSTTDMNSGSDYRLACFKEIPSSKRGLFRFHDFMSPEDLATEYQTADVFCIPSKKENFPTTALEALRRKLPVVASVSSGVADFSYEAPGLLFEPSNANSLSNLIISLSQLTRIELDKLWNRQYTRAREITAWTSSVDGKVERYLRPAAKRKVIRSKDEQNLKVLIINPLGSSAFTHCAIDFFHASLFDSVRNDIVKDCDYLVVSPYSLSSHQLLALEDLLIRADHESATGAVYSLQRLTDPYLTKFQLAESGYGPVIVIPLGEDVKNLTGSYLKLISSKLQCAQLAPIMSEHFNAGHYPELFAGNLRWVMSN